ALACGVPINAFETRVDAADSAAFATQEFLREALDFDAQIRAVDVVGGKPGQARDLLYDLHAPSAGQSIPRHERIGVFSYREFARFFDGLLNAAALQIRRKLLVIPRNGSVCRQIEDIRQVIAGVELGRLKIQDRGNQHDAIQIHAVALLEIAGKAGGAGGAVAFSGQKFRRGPAFGTRGIQPDEIGDGFYVWRYAVKLLRRFAGNGAAVSRRYGVDEHEIADVEE